MIKLFKSAQTRSTVVSSSRLCSLSKRSHILFWKLERQIIWVGFWCFIQSSSSVWVLHPRRHMERLQDIRLTHSREAVQQKDSRSKDDTESSTHLFIVFLLFYCPFFFLPRTFIPLFSWRTDKMPGCSTMRLALQLGFYYINKLHNFNIQQGLLMNRRW